MLPLPHLCGWYDGTAEPEESDKTNKNRVINNRAWRPGIFKIAYFSQVSPKITLFACSRRKSEAGNYEGID